MLLCFGNQNLWKRRQERSHHQGTLNKHQRLEVSQMVKRRRCMASSTFNPSRCYLRSLLLAFKDEPTFTRLK